jgi:hypothetical protein
VFNHGVDPAQVPLAGMAINALAFRPGDYNRDDRVDAADYDAWRASFGHVVAAFSSADGNGDGSVDAADYVVWRNAVGQPAVGALTTATVPEPSTTALSCTGLLTSSAICRFRRAKKQLTFSTKIRSLADGRAVGRLSTD